MQHGIASVQLLLLMVTMTFQLLHHRLARGLGAAPMLHACMYSLHARTPSCALCHAHAHAHAHAMRNGVLACAPRDWALGSAAGHEVLGKQADVMFHRHSMCVQTGMHGQLSNLPCACVCAQT